MLPGVDGTITAVQQRRQLYSGPLSKLRMLMICRMAKPEEVLIVEDENGNIVRETMKDNDVLVQYKVSNRMCSYFPPLYTNCVTYSALHLFYLIVKLMCCLLSLINCFGRLWGKHWSTCLILIMRIQSSKYVLSTDIFIKKTHAINIMLCSCYVISIEFVPFLCWDSASCGLNLTSNDDNTWL